jgi:hypothetical protein
VLGGLCSLALLATLQPLLLPRQPRLPQLPAAAPLPAGWKLLPTPTPALPTPAQPIPALPTPPQPRSYRPFFSAMAVGSSSTLQGPDGDLVRLTPLASWSQAALDPTALVPAPGQANSNATAACLTPDGTLESDQEALQELLLKAEPLPRLQKLLYTLLPAPDRSFSCLLVNTSRPQLLRQPASARSFWLSLSRAVRWPPPPGY